MTASIRERLIPKGIESDQWSKMSLMDKMKMSYGDDKMHKTLSRWPSKFAGGLFWYTTMTQLYCFLRYIIPEYFEHYDVMTRYYFKVFFTFIILQGSMNWFCVKLYDTANRKTLDNPDPENILQETEVKNDVSKIINNGSESNDSGVERIFEDKNSDRNGLVWGFCKICDLPKPPRTHHCKICNICILKRDHHCFFTDACVGYRNQRYFVILNFYIAIASLFGMIYNVIYLNWKLGADSTWWDYFLPQTLANYWFNEIPLYYVFMVSHLYIMWWAGGMAAGFFVLQMIAISSGQTSWEAFKQMNIKSTSSRDANFRSVFGAFWGINFLFPAVLVFRQDGDGKNWKDVKCVTNISK